MLTNEQIIENKEKFLKLVAEINIEGADTQGLVEYLDKTDFFVAPASTQYHNNFKGGLCEHSLNVCEAILDLANNYFPNRYSKSTLLVVSLFHDISKVNFYESTIINKKIYSDKGTKQDNQGRFDWFAESVFKVKDVHDRFLAGTHEENSLLILSQYIPLTLEESVAIMNHHATASPNAPSDLSAIMNKFPLLTLLHLSDLIGTYIKERI